MKRLMFTVTLVFLNHATVSAQAERFDIAAFAPPQGWTKTEANGGVAYSTSTASGRCQIVLYPSVRSKGDAKSDFETAWTNIIANGLRSDARPTTATEKRPDGWDMYSGAANITQSGVAFGTMVMTASGSGRSMSIQATIAGTGADCLPAIKAFVDSLRFGAAPSGSVPPAGPPAGTATATQSSFAYDYIAPEGWIARRMEGHIRLDAPGGSCFILIFPPQRSSGDLQRDASAILDQMYPTGWEARGVGEQRYTFSKGVLPRGHEFFMIEAGMRKPSADGARYEGFEDGVALVVRAGQEIAVIAARHNSPLIEHEACIKRYDRWRRFLNSFAVRTAPTAPQQEDPAKRIIGRWSMSESGGIGEYIFAANGNFAFGGAIGSTRTTSDIDYDRLYITTYSFPGDGSYKLTADQLTLRRRGGDAEQARIRFDKADHGGTGWVDRIHIYKRGAQGENEVTYVKRSK